ncbi:hypothetical protein D3C75_1154840 [compost metagenome]
MVNHLVLKLAFRINDEQTAESNAFLFNKHTVVLGDGLGNVRSQREAQLAQAIGIRSGVDPGAVGMNAVDADTQHFSIQILKLSGCIGNCSNFSRAYKGKVQRIEEEHQPFALIVGQGYLAEAFSVT